MINIISPSFLRFLQELAEQVAEVFVRKQHFVALLRAFDPHGHALGFRAQVVLSDLSSLLVDDPPLLVSDHVLLDLEYPVVCVLFNLLLPHYHRLALGLDYIVVQTSSQVHHARLLVRHLPL